MDMLKTAKRLLSKESLVKKPGPPPMDAASYGWPDLSLEPVIVDFSKAGREIRIEIPTETLQNWL